MILVRLAFVAVSYAMVMQARAAGGHHAVDDAITLGPGQCLLESWGDREQGGRRTLIHLGSACRIGAVELGLNVDRLRLRAVDSTLLGPQIKWAVPLSQSLSAGVVLSATWQDATPEFVGGTLVFPMTWQLNEAWLVHVNIGRDFRHVGPDHSRTGAAIEWAASPTWSFVVERFRENELNFWRGGARYAVSSNVSIDLSHARGSGAFASPWWTLGLNWQFDR